MERSGATELLRLLLTAPPYLLAAVLAILISHTSDRKPERCFHLAIPLCVGMIGFVIATTTNTVAPRYVSLFLMIGGLFGSYNVALAWISSTFPRPRAKRAAAYATINSLGNGKHHSPRSLTDSRPDLVTLPIRFQVLTSIHCSIRH